MEKQDWIKMARLAGYVYVPIGLLVVAIFLLIEWNAYKISAYQKSLAHPLGGQSATTTP